MEYLAALVGFFKFFDVVASFIKSLEKTDPQKHRELLAQVIAAFDKADSIDPKTGKPSDDVSEIEDLINR